MDVSKEDAEGLLGDLISWWRAWGEPRCGHLERKKAKNRKMNNSRRNRKTDKKVNVIIALYMSGVVNIICTVTKETLNIYLTKNFMIL